MDVIINLQQSPKHKLNVHELNRDMYTPESER